MGEASRQERTDMLARCTFHPKSTDEGDLEEFWQVVDCFISEMVLGGRVTVEQVSLGWVDDDLVAYCELPEAQSLNAKWDGPRCRGRRKRLLDCCTAPPTIELLDDGPPSRHVLRWKQARSFILKGNADLGSSPVESGDDGRPVPVYRLGLSDRGATVTKWLHRYRQLWRAQRTIAPLRTRAYKELADPQSELGQIARDLSKEIEARTGKATYYYLWRRYGRDDALESRRRCPLCNGDWFVHADVLRPIRGVDTFHFRCDPCRLISVMACERNLRLAHVGEPAPGSPTRRGLEETC